MYKSSTRPEKKRAEGPEAVSVPSPSLPPSRKGASYPPHLTDRLRTSGSGPARNPTRSRCGAGCPIAASPVPELPRKGRAPGLPARTAASSFPSGKKRAVHFAPRDRFCYGGQKRGAPRGSLGSCASRAAGAFLRRTAGGSRRRLPWALGSTTKDRRGREPRAGETPVTPPNAAAAA